MEHSGNIPIFNIPGTLFWEYSPEFHRELFPNIPGIYHGNVPRIFHEHIFARSVATLRPRILRAGPWELNLWHWFLVSRPAPQIKLTLTVKQILIIKSQRIWVENLGAWVDGQRHLLKYFDIWHNTKKLENTVMKNLWKKSWEIL